MPKQHPQGSTVADLLERSRYRGGPVTWDDVIGHAQAKRELAVAAAQLLRHTSAEELGLALVKGILITGAPGTGKSLLATAIGRPAYILPTAEMTPQLLRQVYEALAHEPSLVVWDECDALIPERLTAADTRMSAAFCAALDGCQPVAGPITVGLTAADPRDLDASAQRPGRLTTRVVLSRPNEADRRFLWARLLARVPVEGDIDIDRLVDESHGRTGADIEATVQVALGLSLVDGTDAVTDGFLGEALGRAHRVVEPEESPVVELPEDQWREAVHEAGHAVVGAREFGADAVVAVRLEPWGGVTTIRAQDGRDQTRGSVLASVRVACGGIAAEELLFEADQVSTSSTHDIENVTSKLLDLFGAQGASAGIGPINTLHGRLRPLSEQMTNRLWAEVSRAACQALADARTIVEEEQEAVVRLARRLHDAPGRSIDGTVVVAALEARAGVPAPEADDPDAAACDLGQLEAPAA